MCVAIVKTPNHPLTDAVLRACFEANDHGAGFAYVGQGNKLIVEKGYFTFGEFLAAYRPIEEQVQADTPMLVHFRISTGGTRTKDNCHPFLFKHGALIHNGHFFPAVGDRSDTNVLTERVGPNLTREAVQMHKKALEEAFGLGNKVAILYPDKSYEIINEGRGGWIDGNWFSNDFWKYRMNRPAYTPYGQRIPDRIVGTGGSMTAYDQQWGRDFHVD
jgi:hypothetical protein